MNRHQHARMVANHAEDRVVYLLEKQGLTVTRHGSRGQSSLAVNGKLWIEARGATWTAAKIGKGRYQFNTRLDADVYVLCCIGDMTRCFIVPGHIVEPYANIAIWSQDPRQYKGKWSPYLENWDILDQEVA